MWRREFIKAAGVGIALSTTKVWARQDEDASQKKLAELVKSQREKYKLPGMAAAVVRGDRMVAAAVSGVRHVEKPDLISIDDRFAIASCTKTMTQLAITRLVDLGKLSFDTTIGEVLPDIEMRDVYRQVTLAQLLTFQGGIQPYTMIIGPQAQALFSNLKGSPAEQRLAFVRHVLQEEPIAEPGTGRNYSNASYAVAAFLATKRTGQEWESLMQEQVFGPLGMTRAGFGRPSNAEHPNEPWLHTNGAGLRQKGKAKTAGNEKGKAAGNENAKAASNEPYRPQPEEIQKSAALAAAGDVHCSIGDFCKFVSYELQAANGHNGLLKKETAQRAISLFPRPDGASFRGGSPFVSAGYTLWPSRNLAAAALVNAGGAEEACTEIFEEVEAGA